jgi:hypothetical protein
LSVVFAVVNSGATNPSATGTSWDVDFFTVFTPNAPALPAPPFVTGAWGNAVVGQTGVAAMQLQVISETYAVVIDKVENNPLQINGHAAWSSLYNREFKPIFLFAASRAESPSASSAPVFSPNKRRHSYRSDHKLILRWR